MTTKKGFMRFFTDDEIATICGVSPSTVYRWRNKKQDISPSAKRLLALHKAKRIMPDDWSQRGFSFSTTHLYTGTGFQFNPSELEQFAFYMDFLRTMENTNKQLHEYVDYLESLLPRANVVKFDRSKCRKSLTEGKEFNQFFNKPTLNN